MTVYAGLTGSQIQETLTSVITFHRHITRLTGELRCIKVKLSVKLVLTAGAIPVSYILEILLLLLLVTLADHDYTRFVWCKKEIAENKKRKHR